MHIRVDFLEPDQLVSVEKSADVLYERVRDSTAELGESTPRDLVWPAIGATGAKVDPELVLLPLDRVGAEQGFSGSFVMIGYFVDRKTRLYPSHPLVIKVSKSNAEHKAKLKEEADQARTVQPYVAQNIGSFAVPLHFDEFENAVLWSPFSSNEGTGSHLKDQKLSLKISDLWRLLRRTYVDTFVLQPRNTSKLLSSAYKLMQPLHDRSGTAEKMERELVSEYKRYLRKFSPSDGWGKGISLMWPDEVVDEFGQKFYNPVRLLSILNGHKAILTCGAVHGDFHPRNVVLSEGDAPNIIDFGWAADKSHIAKDFVLMECNLRFVSIRPDLPWSDVETMAEWIAFDAVPPVNIQSDDARSRIADIVELRKIARSHFGDSKDWDNEYIVPLFLTAFGLLRVLPSIDNQLAARMFLLKLSDYLRERFPS